MRNFRKGLKELYVTIDEQKDVEEENRPNKPMLFIKQRLSRMGMYKGKGKARR